MTTIPWKGEGMAEAPRLSRRELLQGAGAAALASAVGARALAQDAPAAPAGLTRLGPGAVPVAFTLNGRKVEVAVEPRVTLLDALRERIGATGTKRVCDRGACGACTVLLDGVPVNACLQLAVECHGRTLTTIEGLTNGNGAGSNGTDGGAVALHPVQAAFVAEDAQQCGFCTPGMVMSCVALLAATPKPTEDDIRRAISGNLCRCGTYPHVVRACQRASR
jgi:aerobic-type carbon monoxide dehydrogenase small subunit (CoxS/CutS family)